MCSHSGFHTCRWILCNWEPADFKGPFKKSNQEKSVTAGLKGWWTWTLIISLQCFSNVTEPSISVVRERLNFCSMSIKSQRAHQTDCLTVCLIFCWWVLRRKIITGNKKIWGRLAEFDGRFSCASFQWENENSAVQCRQEGLYKRKKKNKNGVHTVNAYLLLIG